MTSTGAFFNPKPCFNFRSKVFFEKKKENNFCHYSSKYERHNELWFKCKIFFAKSFIFNTAMECHE